MKKEMLNQAELNQFKSIWVRIVAAMKENGIDSVAELNRRIEQKRGYCPDKSVYSKLKTPEANIQGYYNISSESLYVIADALNVSLDYLLTGKEHYDADSPNNDYSLGLSKNSLEKLRLIFEKAKTYNIDNIIPNSSYYRNPFEKQLDMLNWIIEHVNVTEDSETVVLDFLTALYLIIKGRFYGFRGGQTEIVLNEVVNNISLSEIDCLQTPIEELKEVRNSLLDNRIIAVGDSISFDEVEVPMPDPKVAIKEHLNKIINDWENEYAPTGDKIEKLQKEEFERWFDNENS